MPTILLQQGWRLFFYSNEGNEPVHVHCRKGASECKYWLLIDRFDIKEDYSRCLGPRERRQIRRIIFENFDYIAEEWRKFDARR